MLQWIYMDPHKKIIIEPIVILDIEFTIVILLRIDTFVSNDK